MSVEGLPPEGTADGEIAALIATLHETERRLEELTAGEVDTVADRDGRTILLRHAQDQLRDTEAARQAAILDALPAHVALLDAQGTIVSVNEAWRRFGAENAQAAGASSPGTSYLDICDCATGNDSAEAGPVAAGIRAVIAGSLKRYAIEYPCHSPTEQRWFLLQVVPVAGSGSLGAVVMHVNVTAQQLADQGMRESESRFRQMAENISDVFFLQNAQSSEMYYVSPAYERIWGRSCESLYANPGSWIDAFHPDDLHLAVNQLKESRNSGFDYEFRILRPDGGLRWIHVRGFPIVDEAGNLQRIAGIASDITERKEAATRIGRLNRVHAVLSGIDAVIVRATDRDGLFAAACRIAVEAGGFRLAWIGMLDPSTKTIDMLASAGGNEAFVAAVRSRLASSGTFPSAANLGTRAIREQVAVVVNDTQENFTAAVPGEHVEAGIQSMAVLPLLVGGDGVGVLALYSGDAGFFDEQEMKLLTELAGDIAFAIDHIGKQERLEYLAYHDVLTGLSNRSRFLDRVCRHMRAAAAKGGKLALFLLDLERFKNINDSLGRPAGDALLKQVAEWLTRHTGDAELVGRIDADHFAIVLPEVKQDGNVAKLVEGTLEAFLAHPFRIGEVVLQVAARVGVAIYPDDGADADTLFRNAEAALKHAKKGGERCLFYAQKMNATAAGNLTLENQLRRAMERDEFVLHYQPKTNLATGKLTGAEALIRWNDPRTGLVPPGRFIPILEETGLILEVGRWALRRVVEDYLRWRTAGMPAVRIAVNVSARQLRHRGFIAEVERVCGMDPHAAAGLELEITESLIMEDIKLSIASLQALRAMGVTVAIDDFGTGFSSLSYLAKLPVDTLKIDRSFVIDMTSGPQGLALISTIISLAHALELKVVAEGVEAEEQSQLLRLLRCDEMQGFLVSKAVPVEEFEAKFLAA